MISDEIHAIINDLILHPDKLDIRDLVRELESLHQEALEQEEYIRDMEVELL